MDIPSLARQIEYGPTMRQSARDTLILAGTKSAAGLTQLLQAPGAKKQYVLVHCILQNETDTAQTLGLQNGGGAWLVRLVAALTGNGISRSNWYRKVGPNQALMAYASGATQIGYCIEYYVEDTD